jgi:hypothetical protein
LNTYRAGFKKPTEAEIVIKSKDLSAEFAGIESLYLDFSDAVAELKLQILVYTIHVFLSVFGFHFLRCININILISVHRGNFELESLAVDGLL